ncbi:hypothetical protein PHYBOEH_002019 [Phytophthora boehmeriae]|uniref:RWP-RK domain-containing protein n=1 Tax=Phytophthora boehmeriae TaxID=109152 RepID=A0A8T1WXT5_9STRA|nr:hypothetical protein PHYBOEH_002019 [Phytophthora boehmeriae]
MTLPPLAHKRQLSSSTVTTTPIKRRKLSETVSSPSSPSATSSTASAPVLTPSQKPTSRPNMTASSSITLDMLRPHFEEPLAKVAATFGICVTLLKKICRRHGITRWPHRQITGLRKSISSMEHAIDYFDGDRRESYAEQLLKQKNKLAALLENPTSSNPALATEEDRFDDNVRRQVDVPPAQTSSGNGNDVSLASTPSRISSPTGPLLPESPFYGAAPQPTPLWLSVPHQVESHYTNAPRYHQLCPPVKVEFVPELRPAVSYYVPNGAVPSASAIYVPPLRRESPSILPPISSLVAGSSSLPTTMMPTSSW